MGRCPLDPLIHFGAKDRETSIVVRAAFDAAEIGEGVGIDSVVGGSESSMDETHEVMLLGRFII